jgi:2-methylcitrate dehydratase PrpD
MLTPLDFTKKALIDEVTCNFMEKIEVLPGGPNYDKHYPEGFPTNVIIYLSDGTRFSSGVTKFP